jgi:hypothetical protein
LDFCGDHRYFILDWFMESLSFAKKCHVKDRIKHLISTYPNLHNHCFGDLYCCYCTLKQVYGQK